MLTHNPFVSKVSAVSNLTMENTQGLRRLANDRIVWVDEQGKSTFQTCGWLIEVASGNPEPDSIEDTVEIVECGEPLFALSPDCGSWRCAGGHCHWEYGSPEQIAQERAEWQADLLERVREGVWG